MLKLVIAHVQSKLTDCVVRILFTLARGRLPTCFG